MSVNVWLCPIEWEHFISLLENASSQEFDKFLDYLPGDQPENPSTRKFYAFQGYIERLHRRHRSQSVENLSYICETLTTVAEAQLKELEKGRKNPESLSRPDPISGYDCVAGVLRPQQVAELYELARQINLYEIRSLFKWFMDEGDEDDDDFESFFYFRQYAMKGFSLLRWIASENKGILVLIA